MSDESLEKIYDPLKVEEKWMCFWEEMDLFHADAHSDRPSFSMVIPPPNVTGSLHLGHALNSTLQDILARWKRMSGYNVLWIPGTDHAGIATQNVVERQLAGKGADRHGLGRKAFIKRVWKWKEQSGGTILNQLKQLGASCDWQRERFTMDPGLSRAVQEIFIRLYKEGLIYRNKRLINLCPHCRTALSDIEVEHEEVQGKLYTIKYPLADDPETFLAVATTRPETMLGDTAVAVHPEDERFNQLIGKKVRLPLTGREIPVIADPILVDREFGTGAVKITPGHDFNDERSGKRHRLEKISLIEWDGKMSSLRLHDAKVIVELCKELDFKTMGDARKIVIRALNKTGFLIKTEDHTLSLGKCYRCKTVVEPFDSPQWFVKVNAPENSLVQPAIEAVRQKKIRIIPSSWESNYFGWMENIEDWCISRQIWWGHQIPVWYCRACDKDHISEIPGSDKTIIFSEASPIVGGIICPQCGGAELVQDPDVLDTWFSSALWPFSTTGWPSELQPDTAGRVEAEALLKQFYPTSTLVSAFDILFFWIARMIMMGLHFMKEIPFKEVYIHALVRDADGQKMSKSKGNVINPLELMEQYGTDALRFTLAAMASPGRDIKLSQDRIEGYRNFCNKLWNAARFIMMNDPGTGGRAKPSHFQGEQSVSNRWIKSRLNQTIESVNGALGSYRFDEAAKFLYQFSWHTFCDWYLELAKVDLQNEALREETFIALADTFEAILRLLHPFMPFLTEELWGHFSEDDVSLSLARYPSFDALGNDSSAEEVVQSVIIDTVLAVRNIKGEMNIPPSERPLLLIKTPDSTAQKSLEEQLRYIKRLARLDQVRIGPSVEKPRLSATATTRYGEIYLPLQEAHLLAESGRIRKRLDKVEKTVEMMANKLNNAGFIENAPEAVVTKTKLEQKNHVENQAKLSAELSHLQSLLSGSSDTR